MGAAGIAALSFFVLVVIASVFFLAPFPWKDQIALFLDGMLIIFIVLLLIPWKHHRYYPVERLGRADERDTPFSRFFSSAEQTDEYYLEHPGKRDHDAFLKTLPGLLSPKSRQYHPWYFASADAIESIMASLRERTRGVPSETGDQDDVSQLQDYIDNWAKKLGALDTGVCTLKPSHFYTIRGRSQYYGKPVDNHHSHAFAFLVEMDRDQVATAPQAPVVLESYRQYLKAGVMAILVAKFLRKHGWEATAHIDGNYDIICPTVARDAGLGEIGRMGILISRKTGPRCRIGVVTTNAPLKPALVKQDRNILYFCEQCKKCVDCCPTRAIPAAGYQPYGRDTGWKIDHDRCFEFWCREGTDCGRCMAVCPFSHDKSWIHRLTRQWISHSMPFAWLAVRMDDLFYGKRPKGKRLKR